jgi:predicted transcriptional regulator
MAFFPKVSEMHALETSRILTEEYSAKILLATMGKPKSAFELSEKLGVPIAACYRKIKILEDSGLINCVERRLTQAGKRISLYKSNVKNAQIVFERNKIRANIEMIDGTSQNSTFDVDMSAFMEMSKPQI